MQGYCHMLSKHSQVLWPRDASGVEQCPFTSPVLIEGYPGVYFDYDLEAGILTGFDDVARQATVYDYDPDLPEPQPIPGPHSEIEVRPYTEEENARADALQNDAAVKQAQADLERAVQLNAAPAELQALQEATLANEGIEEGDPWRQPTGAHDAYPLGAIVTHNDKTWESTVAANVWEPGVSGWMEAGPGIPDWVQPTGAHDAYPLGAVVRHNGLVWESLVASNVWEPGAPGSETLWAEIPDPEA